MKNKFISLAVLVVLLASGSVFGAVWAEWNFDTGFSGPGRLYADNSSDADSLLKLNVANSSVYSISGGILYSTGSDEQAEFLQADINDSAANGGGDYVNEFTMIWDIRTDVTSDWIGLFNANLTNSNASELWLGPDGSVGKGSQYTDPGVVPQETWTRLAVTYHIDGGNTVRDLYVDGVLVRGDDIVSSVDGSFSLWTNEQEDPYQWCLFGAWDGAMYLDAFKLDNFGYAGWAMSGAEIAALGAYDCDVIGIPEPTSLILLGMGAILFRRRASK